MQTMTSYEWFCLGEVKHWMAEKSRAALDHDEAGQRMAQYHLDKWSDRLQAAKDHA